MASGCYTGWQHQLMDMENLTKEEFIKFCDDNFYHLIRFGISINDAKNQKSKYDDIKRYEQSIKEKTRKMKDIKDINIEDIQKEYDEYVENIRLDNQEYLESFLQESKRYQKILQYVNYFRGEALDYIWKGLKQPELYQSTILSFKEYCDMKLNIHGYDDDIERYNYRIQEVKAKIKEEKIIINNYEELKENFLRSK